MGQPAKDILKRWSPSLAEHGFHLKGNAVVRNIGILEQSIALQRSQRAAPGKLRINLYLSIKDDFLERPEFILCLHGRVTSKNASFHDAESFWGEEQLVSSGLSALLNHGLGWFERFGKDAEVLSGWLERAVRERKPVDALVERAESAHPEIEAMIAPYIQNSIPAAPPIYRRFLGLLRFEQGQLASACDYAQAYLESLRRREVSFPGEPERTLRQIREMGCSKAVSPKQN